MRCSAAERTPGVGGLSMGTCTRRRAGPARSASAGCAPPRAAPPPHTHSRSAAAAHHRSAQRPPGSPLMKRRTSSRYLPFHSAHTSQLGNDPTCRPPARARPGRRAGARDKGAVLPRAARALDRTPPGGSPHAGVPRVGGPAATWRQQGHERPADATVAAPTFGCVLLPPCPPTWYMPRSQGSAMRCFVLSTGCFAISRISGGADSGTPLSSAGGRGSGQGRVSPGGRERAQGGAAPRVKGAGRAGKGRRARHSQRPLGGCAPPVAFVAVRTPAQARGEVKAEAIHVVLLHPVDLGAGAAGVCVYVGAGAAGVCVCGGGVGRASRFARTCVSGPERHAPARPCSLPPPSPPPADAAAADPSPFPRAPSHPPPHCPPSPARVRICSPRARSRPHPLPACPLPPCPLPSPLTSESMMSCFTTGWLALTVLPQPLKLSSCTYWLGSTM